MPKDSEKFYSIAMIALILSGLATALMSKETIRITIKNLAAGLCAGTVVIIVGDALGFSHGIVLLLSNIMTAFATKFWPMIGEIFERWVKVKLPRMLGIDSNPKNDSQDASK